MGSNQDIGKPVRYKRKKKKRFRRSTIILLLIMLIYLVFHYISLEIKHQNLVEERDQLKMSLQETESYHQQLLEQVEESKSDKYIERLARKYFGLVYPDEKVYIEKEADNPD